jgi:hypothetical protein
MIAAVSGAGGLHLKSEVDDQPIGDSRRLTVEWTTGL